VEASTLAAAPCAAALKPQSKFSLPTGAAPFSSVRPAGASTGKHTTAAAGGGGGPSAPAAPAPLFDPRAPEAVVLNQEQWAEGAGKLPSGRPVVPVVVDPYIARSLRPHQREGVRFMYECVTGLRWVRGLGG
jgi:DNA repair and recombination protein RAD54B